MNLPLGSNPIRVLLIPVALTAFLAAAQAFIAGADTRAIITAVLGVLIVAAQEIGRALVTPVPKPTGEDGGVILALILALLFAAVTFLLAAALALPYVVCVILAVLGAVAGWVVGAGRPEL